MLFRSLLRSTLFASLVVVAAACSSASDSGTDAGAPIVDGACDVLVPSQCGFPFPSNVYAKDDATSKTGKRVAFDPKMLTAISGEAMDPATWADSDGFSPGQAPMTQFLGATVEGLPTQDTIEASIKPDSPTILLDVDAGTLVPHFAELDMSALYDDDRAFMIRPVVRLKDGARYIVAIRHVLDASHTPIPASPAFQELRDGRPSEHSSIEARRGLYDDIFARLAKAGVARGDLQLAWDYTTASKENNTAAMVAVRDAALKVVGDKGPAYAIDKVEENPNPNIRRRIHGHMTVPLYLDRPDPGGKFFLGPDGQPAQNGTADYGFVVHIPNSATMGKPAALLQNGHGLLGTMDEGSDSYLAQIAETKGYVAFGVDLIGMAHDDVQTVIDSIGGDLAKFRGLVDRQHQGLVNSLLAMRMMKGSFWKDPQVQFNGVSAIDPTLAFYRGDSQGGIFGTTYMAISTDVTRGLLGEPGMPYNLLLNRSVDFQGYFGLLRLSYSSSRHVQLILGLIQMLWDRTEPNGYAPYITQNMLPGTPAHNVVIHAAIGDHQVTPLGAHIIARAIGAKNLNPVNRTIFGIPDRAGPLPGPAMVEFSFGLPVSPLTNTPPTGPDSDDPHDKVRVLNAAIDMSDEFFRKGDVVETCSGVCDPE